jgi:dipeptidyl-peptidase-4
MMNTSDAYTFVERGRRIVAVDIATGARTTLFDAGRHPELGKGKIEHHEFSRDETRLLIAVDRKRLWRHSFTARHFMCDLASGRMEPLSDRPSQRCAVLSPDGCSAAFVSENDLYIRLPDGSERRVTDDGRAGEVINGAPDWVYEEEFGLTTGIAWSPDGCRVAFLRFDESAVPAFTLFRYEGGYPEPVTFKYPRAGEPNASASLHVHDIASGETREVARTGDEWEYMPRIQWLERTGELAYLKMNRLQRHYEWAAVGRDGSGPRRVLAERRKPWVEAPMTLHVLPDGRILAPSERSGRRHLHLFDARGRHVRQVTTGEWELISLVGVDTAGDTACFIAARPEPRDRTLWAVSLKDGLEWRIGPASGSVSVVSDRRMSRFAVTHSTSGETPVVDVYDAGGRRLRAIQRHAALARRLASVRVPRKEFTTLPGADDRPLNAWLLKPADWEPGKRYPLLMTVYGGPDSQTVTEGWGLGWEHYLAQEGFLVASVDGRGTGARGEEFRKCTYGRLGRFEVEDQASAALALAESGLACRDRIGVFGWSYGGFMAAGCLLRRPDVFAAGIAVAPVTHYRYYDSVYTERYMGLPSANARGYRDNAPLTYAGNLKGRLLLVHGLNDDNVHAQNSLDLVEALIKEGKEFETHFLPNRDHGISGGKTRLHLYVRMTDWLRRNL